MIALDRVLKTEEMLHRRWGGGSSDGVTSEVHSKCTKLIFTVAIYVLSFEAKHNEICAAPNRHCNI
jgi:hypothetical protein